MSKYTTELRYICETLAGMTESKGYNDVDDILEDAAPLLFSFDFPIFDEQYRLPLEIKILKHFYNREIAHETYGLWKLRLDAKMNEIMPYYNALYKTTVFEFNPSYDTDYSVIHTGANKTDTNNTRSGNTAESFGEVGVSERATDGIQHASGTKATNEKQNRADTAEESTKTHGTQTAASDDWDLFQDTPQGGLTGVRANNYLSNARNNTSANSANSEESISRGNEYESEVTKENAEINNTERTDTKNERTNTVNNKNRNTESGDTFTGEITNTNSYVERVIGTRNSGGFGKNIMEFRKTLLNIDMMIIEELNPLFFGLW